MNKYCHVANQFCLAAANFEQPDRVKECYACGLPVCINCSLIVLYNRRNCRLCHNCIEDIDPNRVTRHLEVLAGYAETV